MNNIHDILRRIFRLCRTHPLYGNIVLINTPIFFYLIFFFCFNFLKAALVLLVFLLGLQFFVLFFDLQSLSASIFFFPFDRFCFLYSFLCLYYSLLLIRIYNYTGGKNNPSRSGNRSISSFRLQPSKGSIYLPYLTTFQLDTVQSQKLRVIIRYFDRFTRYFQHSKKNMEGKVQYIMIKYVLFYSMQHRI
jgi:hypothetical protein